MMASTIVLKWIIFATFLVFSCKCEDATREKRQQNDKIRVVSIFQKPYLMGDSNGSYYGYMVDLMDKIAQILNIDYEIYLTPDGKYGQRDSDGSWNGIVGELVETKADIAAAPLTITSVRERVIDFSKPFMGTGLTIMFRKPSNDAPDTSAIISMIFSPFPDLTWIFIILVMILLWGLTYLLHYKIKKPECKSTENNKIKKECNFCYQAFLKIAGIKDENEPVSVVILYAAWRFFIFFTLTLYVIGLWVFGFSSGGSAYKMPISNFEDLVKSNIKAGYIRGGSTETFFRISNVELYERFYAQVQSSEPSSFVLSTEEAIERVRKENYAFIGESTTIDYIRSRHCDLTQVGDLLNSVGYGLATPLGSDLREMINLAILELRESGFLTSLYNKWWHDKSVCSLEEPEPAPKTPGFTYSLVFATRLFYVYGGITVVLCVIALIVRAIEVLSDRKSQHSGLSEDDDKKQETSNC